MADNYSRGEMNISEQEGTFASFIDISVFSSLLIGACILILALIFGTSFGWMTSLIITLGVAGLGGVALNRGALYWVCLGAFAVITVISGVIVSAFGG